MALSDLPRWTPGQRSIESRKMNNLSEAVHRSTIAQGYSRLNGTSTGAGTTISSRRGRKPQPSRRQPVAIAHLVGFVSDTTGVYPPNWNYAFLGQIIPSVGVDIATLDPVPDVIKIFAMYWPRNSDLTFALPVIPFAARELSDVPVHKLSVEPGRDPDDLEAKTAWFVDGFFINGCVEL